MIVGALCAGRDCAPDAQPQSELAGAVFTAAADLAEHTSGRSIARPRVAWSGVGDSTIRFAPVEWSPVGRSAIGRRIRNASVRRRAL